MADELLTRNEFVRVMDARDERLRADIDVRVERLRKALSADMDARDERLRADMNARDERLRDALNVQTEQLREDIQKAAEGYGATLERLERTMLEIHREGHAKWELHDYVLKDHAARITKLERGETGA